MHRRDIGTYRLSWREFRVLVEHLGTKSAYWRSKHPKSWPWGIDTEFLSAILFTLQGANWQRSGGKGDKPKFIKRPNDVQLPQDVAEWDIDAKKKALAEEIVRRRKRAEAQEKRTGKTRKAKIIDRVQELKEGASGYGY